MLYLFSTKVAVLCGSIESIHYVIFCFIQKWLSNVVPSSQYIMLNLFCTEDCLMWFHQDNTLCYICFIQK